MTERILHFIGGISASGKTTMAEGLVNDLNAIGIAAKRPVCYTTRPKRNVSNRPEVDGRDYYFITQSDFDKNFLPQIRNDNPGKWDVSYIEGHWYFNKIEETLPTENNPISVLTVHFATISEMREVYRNMAGIKLTELHLIIPDNLHRAWKERMEILRPGRRSFEELDLQSQMLLNGLIKHSTFEITNNLENDMANFITESKKKMGLIS